MGQDLTWKFDINVAKTFVDHARQHIPNYDCVIDKTVDVCKYLLDYDDCIVDIGCATGETLRRLFSAGFTNLVGVDSSQEMLDYCSAPANLICSDSFPFGQFDAVTMNWTLHFIQNKKQYLEDIFNSLTPGGFLFLSDKTSKDPLSINFYHRHKSSMGVSDSDILAKARSVESIMYINDPAWYLKTLHDIGFKNTQIIDANWCFTTFLAIK